VSEQTTPTTPAPADDEGFLSRLTTGRSEIDFIGRSRLWLLVVVAILAVSALALLVRTLEFSIEFVGGSAFTVVDASEPLEVAEVEAALAELGLEDTIVQVLDEGRGAQISTAAVSEIEGLSETEVLESLTELSGGEVSASTIGPRWGAQVTRQALQGLAVFLLLVVIYLSIRFEWRMAVAAIAALVHDIVASVGLYALTGFQVSPATVIAFLTILGYSLYDTVVVFDRIDEETEGLTSVSTVSYGQVANGALNHVLLRSLSTAITSILPVLVLVIIGFAVTSVSTLLDLSLALLIGMILGIYSSVIVATPLLVWLKEKEPKYAELKERARA
jgi:preprotein translocase subunit SecF